MANWSERPTNDCGLLCVTASIPLAFSVTTERVQHSSLMLFLQNRCNHKFSYRGTSHGFGRGKVQLIENQLIRAQPSNLAKRLGKRL